MRKFLLATVLCGTLDIAYAFVASALMSGRDPATVLRSVATGPFGDAAAGWGAGGVLLGALTHYGIMAAMAAAGLALFARRPLREWPWWMAGALYGIVLWLVMYGLVLPLRFGAPFPNPDPFEALVWGLPHVLCVGWPLALIARRPPTRSPVTS